MLLMQYYYISWKIAPGVHGVLDNMKRLTYIVEEDGMLPEYGKDQLQILLVNSMGNKHSRV